MKRQRIRKLTLTLSLLFFPITLYYFSPVLIIGAAARGIINGSFIVFALLFLCAIPFGRLFCAYLCPGGGLQECAFPINSKSPKQGWKNNIKYVIWALWITAVILCYLLHEKKLTVDFLFETDHGISVSNIQIYIIYYGIVFLIFLPSVLFGKRVFCHYFCWMAPFMVIGTKLRRMLRLPGLHIGIKQQNDCISCGKCNQSCPMALPVKDMIKSGDFNSAECIQCGACIDECPRNVLCYEIRRGHEGKNGDGKKT